MTRGPISRRRVSTSCGSPSAPKRSCRRTGVLSCMKVLQIEIGAAKSGQMHAGLDGGYVRDWTGRKSNVDVGMFTPQGRALFRTGC
jgi:hypothetical protein